MRWLFESFFGVCVCVLNCASFHLCLLSSVRRNQANPFLVMSCVLVTVMTNCYDNCGALMS